MENLNALLGPFCFSQINQSPHLRSTNREGEPGGRMFGDHSASSVGSLINDPPLLGITDTRRVEPIGQLT
jgi:hypothetical protein